MRAASTIRDRTSPDAGRHRDQDLVGTQLVQDVPQVLDRSQHADAVHAQVPLARVVVEQSDRGVAERGVAQHLLDDQLRSVSGADHHRFAAARDDAPRPGPFDQRACQQPRPRDERETQQQVDEPHTGRHAHAVHFEQREDEEHRDGRQRGAARDAPHVTGRDVPPPAVVEPGSDEDRELDPDHQQHHAPFEISVVVAGRP